MRTHTPARMPDIQGKLCKNALLYIFQLTWYMQIIVIFLLGCYLSIFSRMHEIEEREEKKSTTMLHYFKLAPKHSSRKKERDYANFYISFSI